MIISLRQYYALADVRGFIEDGNSIIALPQTVASLIRKKLIAKSKSNTYKITPLGWKIYWNYEQYRLLPSMVKNELSQRTMVRY